MKKRYFLSFAIILLAAIYLILKADETITPADGAKNAAMEIGNDRDMSKGMAASNEHSSEADEAQIQKVIALANTANPSEDNLHPAPFSANYKPVYIPYEEDWCVKSIDLNQRDYLFVQNELNAWRAKTGEIWKNSESVDGGYNENKNGELLEPYKDMNEARLLERVQQDDIYAMLTAIQRQDIDAVIRDKIATDLLVLGPTSRSLMYLTNRVTISAVRKFKKFKQVTPQIKQQLMTSLSYLYYGMSRYDSSVLLQYVVLLGSDRPFGKELFPKVVWTDEDMELVKRNVQKIAQDIDVKRDKKNLAPLSEIDIPKIAHHDFQERIAFLYSQYGEAMETVQRLNINIGPNLEKTDCIKRYTKVFEAY